MSPIYCNVLLDAAAAAQMFGSVFFLLQVVTVLLCSKHCVVRGKGRIFNGRKRKLCLCLRFFGILALSVRREGGSLW